MATNASNTVWTCNWSIPSHRGLFAKSFANLCHIRPRRPGLGACADLGRIGQGVSMAKSCSSADANDNRAAGFTDREIRLMSMSVNTDAERRNELEAKLREWSKANLPGYLSLDEWHEPLSPAVRRQIEALSRALTASIEGIQSLAPTIRKKIVGGLASYSFIPGTERFEKIAAAGDYVDEFMHRAAWVDNVVRGILRGREGRFGRPTKFAPFLTLNDLADMFQAATGKKATRITSRDSDEYDSGPFYEFAAAVWPVVFGKGDSGLSNALRKWAENEEAWNRDEDEDDDEDGHDE